MNNIEVKIEFQDQTMIAYLSGEIDHHTAAEIRAAIDTRIEGAHPSLLILDFANISFMDSSGIGLVMGRYKLMKEIGGQILVTNPSFHIKRVMILAGLDRLAVIDNKKQPQRSDYVGKK